MQAATRAPLTGECAVGQQCPVQVGLYKREFIPIHIYIHNATHTSAFLLPTPGEHKAHSQQLHSSRLRQSSLSVPRWMQRLESVRRQVQGSFSHLCPHGFVHFVLEVGCLLPLRFQLQKLIVGNLQQKRAGSGVRTDNGAAVLISLGAGQCCGASLLGPGGKRQE